MALHHSPHQQELRKYGWSTRGYLPHFDGREVPQFITFRLIDSVPKRIIEAWKRELNVETSPIDRNRLLRRVERYLDQGHGESLLKNFRVAAMVQRSLLLDDGRKYRLFAWVIMPNHVHLLATRCSECTLADIVQSFKSLTSHLANNILVRRGAFWMPDYFDRYIRNEEHFRRTITYIETNPVKAGLCLKPEEFRFSSARLRKLNAEKVGFE